MLTDDEIAKAANAARDSLDHWQQVDAAKALVPLLKAGATKAEAVAFVPNIAEFVKRGMTAQAAADAALAEYYAKRKT